MRKVRKRKMATYWIVFALVAIIAFSVTTYNIVDGIEKAKKEMERMEYLDNSECHNVKHYPDDE